MVSFLGISWPIKIHRLHSIEMEFSLGVIKLYEAYDLLEPELIN